MRQSLDDGSFAHARFAYQNGIVLRPPGQYAHDHVDFFFPADYGIVCALLCPFSQIDPYFVQVVVSLFVFRRRVFRPEKGFLDGSYHFGVAVGKLREKIAEEGRQIDCIVLVFVRYLLSPLRHASPAVEPLRDIMLLVMVVCEAILALRAVPRLRAFMREHDLAGAVAATAFLEGRDPTEEVPRDFLFRWFIPHWKVWLVAIVAVALVAAALYVGELP